MTPTDRANIQAVLNSPGWQAIGGIMDAAVRGIELEALSCTGTNDEKLFALAGAQAARKFLDRVKQAVENATELE